MDHFARHFLLLLGALALAAACEAETAGVDGPRISSDPNHAVKTHGGVSLSADRMPNGDVASSVTGPDGSPLLAVHWYEAARRLEYRYPGGSPIPFEFTDVTGPAPDTVNNVAYYIFYRSQGFHDSPGCDNFPDTVCTTPCCATHDDCYVQNQCTWTSWLTIPPFGKSECRGCNWTAAKCVMKNSGCTSNGCSTALEMGEQCTGQRPCETNATQFPCGCDQHQCFAPQSGYECKNDCSSWSDVYGKDASGPGLDPEAGPNGGYCGDGECGAGEDCSSCPGECSCGGDAGSSGGAGGDGAGGSGFAGSGASSCGDGACDSDEDCSTCPGDCGSCGSGGSGTGGSGSGVCGDGTCDADEDCNTCSGDCGGCGTGGSGSPFCGDGSCDGGEDCSTCPDDCGGCGAGGSGSSFCGDGSCDADEDCSWCSDCGSC